MFEHQRKLGMHRHAMHCTLPWLQGWLCARLDHGHTFQSVKIKDPQQNCLVNILRQSRPFMFQFFPWVPPSSSSHPSPGFHFFYFILKLLFQQASMDRRTHPASFDYHQTSQAAQPCEILRSPPWPQSRAVALRSSVRSFCALALQEGSCRIVQI